KTTNRESGRRQRAARRSFRKAIGKRRGTPPLDVTCPRLVPRRDPTGTCRRFPGYLCESHSSGLSSFFTFLKFIGRARLADLTPPTPLSDTERGVGGKHYSQTTTKQAKPFLPLSAPERGPGVRSAQSGKYGSLTAVE